MRAKRIQSRYFKIGFLASCALFLGTAGGGVLLVAHGGEPWQTAKWTLIWSILLSNFAYWIIVVAGWAVAGSSAAHSPSAPADAWLIAVYAGFSLIATLCTILLCFWVGGKSGELAALFSHNQWLVWAAKLMGAFVAFATALALRVALLFLLDIAFGYLGVRRRPAVA